MSDRDSDSWQLLRLSPCEKQVLSPKTALLVFHNTTCFEPPPAAKPGHAPPKQSHAIPEISDLSSGNRTRRSSPTGKRPMVSHCSAGAQSVWLKKLLAQSGASCMVPLESGPNSWPVCLTSPPVSQHGRRPGRHCPGTAISTLEGTIREQWLACFLESSYLSVQAIDI